jgi:DNA-directed RNA polymerase specialized sigma24 family protein
MTAPPRERADDAAVIEQSWHEPETFAELYDRYAAPIHRYVTRRLGDGAADDVVAETFLAAFRMRRRYDLSRSDARPWLYGIAANMIGKHRRAEVRMLRALARTGTDPAAEGLASGRPGRAGVPARNLDGGRRAREGGRSGRAAGQHDR